MGNWGDAMRIWAAIGVGAQMAGGCPPRSGGCHRLPPSAKGLPLSAKGLPSSAITCHPLPQAVSSLSAVWPMAIYRTNEAFSGCRLISLMWFRLGQVECAARTNLRTVASDWLPENEVEAHVRPVTVCHIGAEALRRWEAKTPRIKEEETCGRAFRRCRRPSPNKSNTGRGRRPAPNGEAEHGSRRRQTTPFAGRATRSGQRAPAEQDLPGAQRRQLPETGSHIGDVWRQRTTDFRARNAGWLRSLAGLATVAGSIRSVGRQILRAIYDHHYTGSSSLNAAPQIEGTGVARRKKALKPRQKTTSRGIDGSEGILKGTSQPVR